MRHSDRNLTMSRYTHIFRGQESEAVAGMPDLSLPSKEAQKAVATGTDDLPVDGAYKPAYKKLAKKTDFDSNRMLLNGTKHGAVVRTNDDIRGSGKSLPMEGLGNKKDSLSSTVTDKKQNTPDRIRTCDLRIRSLLQLLLMTNKTPIVSSCYKQFPQHLLNRQAQLSGFYPAIPLSSALSTTTGVRPEKFFQVVFLISYFGILSPN
mgnify:CR=1 FL=1